jgi:hypothetical protein
MVRVEAKRQAATFSMRLSHSGIAALILHFIMGRAISKDMAPNPSFATQEHFAAWD